MVYPNQGMAGAQEEFPPEAINPDSENPEAFPEDNGPLLVSSSKAESVPAGQYHVQITKVVEVPPVLTYPPGLRIVFTILEEPYVGNTVSGICSRKINSSKTNTSKLYKWRKGLGYGPDDFPEGQEYDIRQVLIGRECYVEVAPKTTDKGTFANVEEVMGAPVPRMAPPPPVASRPYVPPAPQPQRVSAAIPPQRTVVVQAPAPAPRPMAPAPRPAGQAPLQRPVPPAAPRPASIPQGDNINF